MLLSGGGGIDGEAVVAISQPFDPSLLGGGQVVAPLSEAVAGVAAAPFPLSQTFLLHSDPTATKTIYLDFDGHTTSGTDWNTVYNGGANIITPAYSFEGDGSFSNAELERIQYIWERVAEDYLPFDVDVTTADPGADALMKSGSGDTRWGIRVCIGGSSYDWLDLGAGGVCYVGSFNWNTDTPCFVFPDQLGNGAEKYTAEAITHEVGHAVGLGHDGTSTVEYYPGQSTGPTGWAPIMGVGYYQELVQWSKGEYPDANNHEDDLAIITTQNGFGYRVDDHGGTLAGATSIGAVGVTPVSAHGIIERTADLDYFVFTTAGGLLSLDVAPFYRSPNLNVLAKLYNAAGTVIATSDVIGSLSAGFALTLTPGTYYLSVDGTGESTSGFSDYGSLGYYSLTATVEGLSLPYVTLTATDATAAEMGRQPGTFTITRMGDAAAPLQVFYTVAGSAGNGVDYDAIAESVTLPAGIASADVTITPIDDLLPEGEETVVLTLKADPAYVIDSPNSGTVRIADDDLVVSVLDYASSETTVLGTLASGNLSSTRVSDGIYERITEAKSGGSSKKSLSYLEHIWTFSVTGGGNVTFFVEAHHSSNTDGDNFKFEYSRDGASWAYLLTITKTTDDNAPQQASLPGDLRGTVYIRVLDTDRTRGNRSLDSIYIDRMFIRSDPSILGDANCDGTVDALDYLALKGGFGIASGAMWTQGDFDADGNVDMADLLVLKANFGQSVPLAALVVPVATTPTAVQTAPTQAGPAVAELAEQEAASPTGERDPMERLPIGQELLALLPHGSRPRLGCGLPGQLAR
jgi:hypothetical protein